MFKNLNVFYMAGELANHSAARQANVAQNIANADTPDYKAKDIASFAQTFQRKTQSEGMIATRSTHLHAASEDQSRFETITTEAANSPNGNSVSLENEMMKSVEARHHHDLALAVYKSSMNILRSSLGRR